MRAHGLISLSFIIAACHQDVLVQSPDRSPTPGPQPATPSNPTPTFTPPPGWCGSDCDCAGGSRCVNVGSELTGNECQPGPNTCAKPCPSACAAGSVCQAGACVAAPCLGGSCAGGPMRTFYELDIHEFAGQAARIDTLLDVLKAALNGNGVPCTPTTVTGQLICTAANLASQNIRAPAWVGKLIDVLAGMFKFGDKPIIARGILNLAESHDGRITGSEKWTEMVLEYDGAVYDVMQSPTLGTNGQITVTVKAFSGTRTSNELMLGAREIEFDVNKLVINIINIVIGAASGGQANDVPGLIDLVLCKHLTSATQNAACKAAGNQLGKQLALEVSLGGVKLASQRGVIYDDDKDGKPDGYARATPVSARGTVVGEMSNGLVAGSLGAFSKSNWYGAR